jgi:hypothetical protein
MARYGKKAQARVAKVMHEMKHGKLRSGGSGKKVTSRNQPPAPRRKRRKRRTAA